MNPNLNIQPFYVMELLNRAKALEAEGFDVVHLEIGEPDFATPPAIVAAGMAAIATGEVKYTPAAGLPELRAALAQFYAEVYGVEIAARRIFITPGASGAMLLVLAGLLNTGAEVLLADPGYPCYPNFIRVFGGEPRLVPVNVEDDFQLNAAAIDANWTAQTAGVIMASPSNPTGTLVSAPAMARIAETLREKGGFWLSDEIYHGLVYGQPALTALQFEPEAFVINSFSKFFGMTGWRLGWAVVPEHFVELAERLAQNLFISAPTPAQLAALACFTPENLAELERRRLAFQQRRDFLLQALPEIGFTIPQIPRGAFYVYADCSRHTQDSFELAWRLLEQAHVAITPGKDFGSHQAHRHCRIAYTASIERMEEGLRRLKRFLG